MLIEMLGDDIGLLALELQSNGITDNAIRACLGMLKENFEIQILDFRNNEISRQHLISVHEYLSLNEHLQTSEIV